MKKRAGDDEQLSDLSDEITSSGQKTFSPFNFFDFLGDCTVTLHFTNCEPVCRV